MHIRRRLREELTEIQELLLCIEFVYNEARVYHGNYPSGLFIYLLLLLLTANGYVPGDSGTTTHKKKTQNNTYTKKIHTQNYKQCFNLTENLK
jgi:hypothetical protein